jgi:hypothetical protein
MICRVDLTNSELMLASQLGVMRRIASRQRNLPDTTNSKYHWDADIIGAIAEMAYCKRYNIYWCPTINVGGEPDIEGLHIRATTLSHGKLIIREYERDKPNLPYFLIIVQDAICTIAGWAYADEVRQQQFFRPKDETGDAAWWYPQHLLHTDNPFEYPHA